MTKEEQEKVFKGWRDAIKKRLNVSSRENLYLCVIERMAAEKLSCKKLM